MTRRVGLIGKPLKRRHSQVMHDAAFDAAGIDARYVLLELEPDAVAEAVARTRAGPTGSASGSRRRTSGWWPGSCDEVEPDAATIGAVNNVVADGRRAARRVQHRRTRVPGRRRSSRWADRSTGADVVVAGAGGAAHAVVFACLRAGAARVTVGNRTVASAAALVERFADVGTGERSAVALEDPAFEAALRAADLAVNATTVGMVDPGATIPIGALPATATVFDLVYVPAETPLLRAARARGLRAANGSEMLIAQAAIAFERWTGVGGMADVMRTAVAPLLADPTARA